jgi:hypothetical protein
VTEIDPAGRFTAEDKHLEALRELRMRRDVYAKSRMNPTTARRRMAIMQEIADDYAKLAEKERLV